jgi:hypothetical protein
MEIRGLRGNPEWTPLQLKIARERTCTYWDADHWCGAEASIYAAGWRCGEHKPAGNWTENIGRKPPGDAIMDHDSEH